MAKKKTKKASLRNSDAKKFLKKVQPKVKAQRTQALVADVPKKVEKVQEIKNSPASSAAPLAAVSSKNTSTNTKKVAEEQLTQKAVQGLKPKLKAPLKTPADADPKWAALYDKSKDREALPYNMSWNYEAKTAIKHSVLGWGYILANRNDRLEVLFKDGIRYLISNYKS